MHITWHSWLDHVYDMGLGVISKVMQFHVDRAVCRSLETVNCKLLRTHVCTDRIQREIRDGEKPFISMLMIMGELVSVIQTTHKPVPHVLQVNHYALAIRINCISTHLARCMAVFFIRFIPTKLPSMNWVGSATHGEFHRSSPSHTHQLKIYIHIKILLLIGSAIVLFD